MTDIEKYTLLSRRPLSKNDISYIIANVRGAWISCLGGLNRPEELDTQGNIIYSFFCTKLTPKIETNLKQHGLELKFVRI